MNYKQLKKEFKKYKSMYFVANEMQQYHKINYKNAMDILKQNKETYEKAVKIVEIDKDYIGTLEAATGELQFANMQVEYLKNTLEEIKAFSGKLEGKVIENAIERHNLDKIIHAKIIFK